MQAQGWAQAQTGATFQQRVELVEVDGAGAKDMMSHLKNFIATPDALLAQEFVCDAEDDG